MMNAVIANAEWIAVGVNIFIFAAVLAKGEIGKTLYWGGAVLIAIAIVKMRG